MRRRRLRLVRSRAPPSQHAVIVQTRPCQAGKEASARQPRQTLVFPKVWARGAATGAHGTLIGTMTRRMAENSTLLPLAPPGMAGIGEKSCEGNASGQCSGGDPRLAPGKATSPCRRRHACGIRSVHRDARLTLFLALGPLAGPRRRHRCPLHASSLG